MNDEYKKYEFCKAIDCPGLRNDGTCYEKDPAFCLHSAKDLHHWLKNNGFKIVKGESKMSDLTLTLSTAHITETDNKLLAEEKNFTVAKYEEGYFIFVAIGQEDVSSEYSKAFHELIIYASIKNYQYICLDCDAKILDSLPTFDW